MWVIILTLIAELTCAKTVMVWEALKLCLVRVRVKHVCAVSAFLIR